MNGPAGMESTDKDPILQNVWKSQVREAAPDFVSLEADKDFPWLIEQIRRKQTIVISRLEDLPEEAAIDKEFLRHFGTKSTLIIPLVEGGVPMGAISFAVLREEREWPESLVNRLHVVARIFAHAIASKRMDQSLHDSEARLALAAESADVGLWDVDMENRDLWATCKAENCLVWPPMIS